MPLLAVQVEDLRCLRHADLRIDSDLTLISGPNAAGKTSLLEAIFFLGRGHSFRTRNIDRVIRTGANALTVIGHVATDYRPVVVGLRATRDSTEAHISGQSVESLADLATTFPVQAIDPNLHKLVEEGPGGRRRAMDWGVFHVERTFVSNWQRYQRALRQRNAALRSGQIVAAIRAWDSELVVAGSLLSDARNRYVSQLQPVMQRVGRELIGVDVSVALSRGWPSDQTLDEALVTSSSQDMKIRATTVGPHRADMRLRVDGFLARDRVSRGQQKLLAATLIIAQLTQLRTIGNRPGTLLLDDPAAELDGLRLERLMHQVKLLGAQVIATATSSSIPGLGNPTAVFHVEQGVVAPML
jgi:DNA replication and repair protein RecF